jgi:hypothetical protein
MSISLGGLSTQVAGKLALSGGTITGSISSNSSVTAAIIGNAASVLYGNAAALSDIVAVGPTISAVTITDSAGVALDDTAVNTAGGSYVEIIGSGFGTGAIVLTGNLVATSTTVQSSAQILAQLAADTSGTRDIFVVNTDGTAAVKPLAVTFSAFPAWSTSATLTDVTKTVAFSQTLSAPSDSTVTYTLNIGSTLPAGTALTTGGVLSGAITDATTSDTTYSFTVQATDIENQYMPRTFSLGAEAFVTKKLVASDKAAGDDYGWSSSITDDGSRVAVGAFSRDINGSTNVGQVYIYTRSGSAWIEEAILVASDKAAHDWFGYTVSISSDGSRVAVGAPEKNATDGIDFPIAGATYIYTRSGVSWTQEAKLRASDIAGGDEFGWSVSITDDGSRVAIGAKGSNTGGTNAGAAYIFSRSGVSWTQEAKIGASDKVANDYFGWSVFISGDGSRVGVGAYQNDPGGTTNGGAAYIFTRNITSWTQEAKLIASDKVANDEFGYCVSLSIDGSRVVVGAYHNTPGGTTNAGAAYIFTRNDTSWTQEAKLIASDKVASDEFGCSVSITDDGSRVAVGARYSDPGGTANAGAAYIFTRNDTSWTQEAKLIASDNVANDYFGWSVSLTSNGSRVIVGTDENDPGGTLNAGAAYIYTRNGSVWTTVMT